MSQEPGTSVRHPLERIQEWAIRAAAKFAPYCARVEIAGSIRRRRPECSDVDLVLLPRPGALGELGAVLSSICSYVTLDGKMAKRGVLLGRAAIQCDLWIADHGQQGDMFTPDLPPNFGALLLTYTGPIAHNIRLVNMAKSRGWKWSPQRGLAIPDPNDDNAPPEVVSFTERDIYQRLGIPWMEPEQRDEWAACGGMTKAEGQSQNTQS